MFELSSLNGTTGVVFNGVAAGDYSGRSVSSAGDVNGDQMDDFLIGAYYADPNSLSGAGATYLIYGRGIYIGIHCVCKRFVLVNLYVT